MELQYLVKLYGDGGAFMHPILVVFIIGLVFVVERFITLMKASGNTKKFVVSINQALEEGGVEAAIHQCEKTPGPVASIFHAGLTRVEKGIDQVEKAITNAGSIEMAFLEKNLIWLSTVIAIAPMLGFTGTVSGMVVAFETIKTANDISPAIVAGGISQALLTTLFGLIVAMIIQFFNNLFLSIIDRMIVDMEESSVEFVDTLIEKKIVN
jgi:biopolymer transport protein ExbB